MPLFLFLMFARYTLHIAHLNYTLHIAQIELNDKNQCAKQKKQWQR